MTVTCILCKKEPIPYDDSRSFHKFPKDNDLRTKWMNAIGKFTIKKTARICSDHFDSGSYHNTDGYTTLRRLLSTAVPRLISNKDVPNECTETSDKTLSEYCQSTESHINIKLEDISDSDCKVNKDNAYLISQSTVDNSNNKSDAEGAFPYLIITPLETAEHTNDLKISHNEVIKQDHHQDSPGNSNDLKRKDSFINKANYTEIKKISHRVNFKKYCFTRAKFSSDEAWAEFQEFSAIIKNKTASAAKNISRKQKKLKNLKMIIEKLKKKERIQSS